jgi:hypothetical protein
VEGDWERDEEREEGEEKDEREERVDGVRVEGREEEGEEVKGEEGREKLRSKISVPSTSISGTAGLSKK